VDNNNQSATFTDRDLRSEIEYQRRDTIRLFAAGLPALGIAWLFYIVCRPDVGVSPLPTFILFLGACLAYRLADDRYPVASWLLLASMVAASGLMVHSSPSFAVAALGISTVIASQALVSRARSLVAVVALALAVTVGWHLGDPDHPTEWYMVNVLVVYGLAWLATWAHSLALENLAISALGGWAKGRAALIELRERRAELYRVLRSLEEATYRIERMNNELLVARYEADNARAFKTRFVATVSHEMRGPLNLILGFSRMIALYPEHYGEALPDDYRADIDAIFRNSQHLANLVDDVLDLSQIDAQRLPLLKQFIHLNHDVIQDAIESVRPLAKRKDLYLNQDLCGDAPLVWADPLRMRQVMLNLVTNAVRFTERGGITVRSWLEDHSLYVSVADTGPGIDAEAMPDLFKEFSQVLRHQTREGSGTGLGLSICKELVELHGGRIWVESQVGVGTTVYFTVPCTGAAQTPGRLERLSGPRPGRAQYPTCLVLHDDPNLVRMLARGFEKHRVVGLTDEARLLATVEELHPKAVISDSQRAQRIEALLNQRPYSVPLISFSAPSRSDREVPNGIVAYVTKPFAFETLTAIMKQIETNGETVVLLVDDEPDAVRLLEQALMLIPRQYRILRAYSGQQALDAMQSTVPDAVFLDLLMPKMGGEQVIAAMRQSERLHEVPVVVVSAKEAIDLGFKLKTPLCLLNAELDLSKRMKCLETMLDLVSSQYLDEPRSV